MTKYHHKQVKHQKNIPMHHKVAHIDLIIYIVSTDFVTVSDKNC